ncbi:response regulator [Neobacillus ginsengisoli]|uniref:Two-component system response regulator YcbB n=1 Tax=Neobacillus ginsengisoli TaxID=904295 RepID=A0ABT9Y401_9BACI|nr:response regulator [Neobacillus ginsengisoli]MDQ0201912.1 two-component system response regulator YcbB [Neobacillus ginsengisoli]
MNFFIVDDTATIRGILSNIIEEEGLGLVVGEAADGSEVDAHTLAVQEVDILMIDLLMPIMDGIETVREIAPSFRGKIIMISQVETKDMISEAYSLGVDHYITKPINQLEVVSVIKKVSDYLLLEKSLHNIQKSLSFLTTHNTKKRLFENTLPSKQALFLSSAKSILLELGIVGKNGEKDLLNLLEILHQLDIEGNRELPPLKELYELAAKKRLGSSITPEEIRKEGKAVEQRIRRILQQVLEHLASQGLTDYANLTFEYYSSKLFDYTQVRMKMLELGGKKHTTTTRIDIKKFLHALHMEAKVRGYHENKFPHD